MSGFDVNLCYLLVKRGSRSYLLHMDMLGHSDTWFLQLQFQFVTASVKASFIVLRAPDARLYTTQHRRWRLPQLFLYQYLPFPVTPEAPRRGSVLSRAPILHCLMRDEKRPERCYRHHNNRNGSFHVVPQHDPCDIDCAIAGAPAGNPDDGYDHCTDTESENAAQGEFAADANLDVPENKDWN